MLARLKILIYENWFNFLSSFLISFLIYKNILLVFPLSFLFTWQIVGSLSKSIFFSFIFLPTFLVFKNNFSLSLLIIILLFFLTFLFFKKKMIMVWLIFLFTIFLFFYLNYLNKINIFLLIIFSVFTLLFFSLFLLNQDFFSSLIFALITFEAMFLLTFLPFNFYFRCLVTISFLFLILKFDIIKKWILSQ